MIFAAIVTEAVRVIVPASPRREVKLGSDRLGVERHLARRRIGQVNLIEPLGRGFPSVDVEENALASPTISWDGGPPVGLVVGQFDIERKNLLTFDRQRQVSFGAASLDRENKIGAIEQDGSFLWANDVLGLGVGEDNLIDVDVTPPSCGAVDDLYDPLFASKIAHVPRGREKFFAAASDGVGSGGGSNDLAVDEKPDEGLVLPASPADEKTDVVTIDRETGTGDRAGRAIAIKEAVDESLPFEAGDRHLSWKSSHSGALTERGACCFPEAVSLLFEVSQNNVV